MQEGNFITLRAVFGKGQGPLIVTPVRDTITNKLLGVKNLSEEEKRKSARVVNADTTRKLQENTVFDLDNEVDAIDWEWIRHNKEICMSREETKDNPNALFYVDQPDKIIDDRVKLFSKKFEAAKIIEDLSREELEELCRYLGQDVKSYKLKEIQDFLITWVESKPDSIINAKHDRYYKEKIFLYRLLDRKILTKDSSGIVKYGDIIVGLNTDASITWLNDQKNRDLVGKMYLKLYGEPSADTGSVIDEFETLNGKGKNKKAGKSGKAGKAANEKDESEEAVTIPADEEVI